MVVKCWDVMAYRLTKLLGNTNFITFHNPKYSNNLCHINVIIMTKIILNILTDPYGIHSSCTQ
jgi:hypothetical protein